MNKLAKSRKTRKSPGTLSLKKFGLGIKASVQKKFGPKRFFMAFLAELVNLKKNQEILLKLKIGKQLGSAFFNFSRRATIDADRMEIRQYHGPTD